MQNFIEVAEHSLLEALRNITRDKEMKISLFIAKRGYLTLWHDQNGVEVAKRYTYKKSSQNLLRFELFRYLSPSALVEIEKRKESFRNSTHEGERKRVA